MAVGSVTLPPLGTPAPQHVPPRAQLTLMAAGGPPSRIDHPQSSGGLRPPSPMPPAAPAVGVVTNETPFRMMAQIRDGVAAFGSNAVHVIELPLLTDNTIPALAQVSAAQASSRPGISTRMMIIVHGMTPG